MAVAGSVSSIRTPDGVIHDITDTTLILVFEKTDGDVDWTVLDFSGVTEKITGTEDDYQLNMQASS